MAHPNTSNIAPTPWITGHALNRAGRVAGIMAALLLTACGSDAEPEVAATPAPVPQTEPTGCPQVAIVGDAAQAVIFRDGGALPSDIAGRGVIADYTGGCEYDVDRVSVSLVIDIIGERGPALTGSDLPLEYFVAIADPQRRILAKEVFDTAVSFAPGAALAGTREELDQVIPLTDPGIGTSYEILIGFQLTEDQLEFNRR